MWDWIIIIFIFIIAIVLSFVFDKDKKMKNKEVKSDNNFIINISSNADDEKLDDISDEYEEYQSKKKSNLIDNIVKTELMAGMYKDFSGKELDAIEKSLLFKYNTDKAKEQNNNYDDFDDFDEMDDDDFDDM